jgi:MFS family permease
MSWISSLDPTTYVPSLLRRKPIRAVYAADAMRNFAVGLFSIFEPVYLYTIFQTFRFPHPASFVFLYYGVLYVSFAYLSLITTRFLSRVGFRVFALVSVPFLLGYYGALLSSERDPRYLVLALILILFRFALFWPAYHLFFARISQSRERGSELGKLAVISAVASALSPAIGGILIERFGFPILFGVVLALLFLSVIPYAVADLREGHRGSLEPITRKFLGQRGRSAVLAFVGQGIEDSAGNIAWPLFLFLLSFSFRELGFITMVATAVGLVATFTVGKLVDREGRQPLLILGAPLAAFMWVTRLIVYSPLSAFVANTLVGLTRPLVQIPFAAAFYDTIASASRGEQMHLILFREVALNTIGRGVFFFGAAALLWFGASMRLILALAIPALFLMVSIVRWASEERLSDTRDALTP